MKFVVPIEAIKFNSKFEVRDVYVKFFGRDCVSVATKNRATIDRRNEFLNFFFCFFLIICVDEFTSWLIILG